MKTCTKCEKILSEDNFVKDQGQIDGLYSWCKGCQKQVRIRWEKKNKLKRPWYNSYMNAKQRCNNPNNFNYPWYGGRGISFSLSYSDCEYLWKRDKAELLSAPTLDRIDNDGDYERENCQFIENKDNSTKDRIGHHTKEGYVVYKRILQIGDDGNIVQIWNSQGEIARSMGLDQGTISKAVKNNQRRYGFYWRKENETDNNSKL